MRFPHLLILCFLVIAGAATAQEYSYARYDVKDGLAGSVVYHGVEDKDGFLWFATETGVSRFDGTQFRNFTKADGLPDNEILKLFVDAKNRVWMLPFRNSICYYWKGKLYNQQNDPLLKKLSVSGRISDIVQNSQGDILLADSRAFHIINTDGQIKTISHIKGDPFDVGSIGTTFENNFASNTTCSKGEIHYTRFTPEGKIISDEVLINRLQPQMSRQKMLISANLHTIPRQDSLFFFRRPGQREEGILIPPGFINLSVINDTVITINTGNGAYFYDINARSVIRHVLPGIMVNSVMQDKEGCSWFLTAGKGVYRIGTYEISNYRLSENNQHERAVFSLYKKDALLYAGSENSLLFTIDLTKKIIHAQAILVPSPSIRILSIVPIPPSQLFIGTDMGIVELNRQVWHKRMQMSVKSLQPDRDSLLAAVEFGLVLHSTKSGDCRDLIRSSLTTTCGYVQDENYYLGTLNGLYVRDHHGELRWLGGKQPLLQGRITDLEGAPDGTLWIATHGEGLVGYKDGQVIHSISQRDGLSSDICRTIYIAGNELWVGTDKGLNRVQWQDGNYKITKYTSADGLIADIINAIYAEGSQVYVGTPAGLTTFDANKISLNSFCKLRMSGIRAADQPWPYDTTGFTLAPNGNSIRFDYVGISYRSAGDITYRYRLMGLNDNWQTTRETFLSYPSLPSGAYELQIMATNKFGVESGLLQIPFQVDKFLWEKIGFRIGILLIALILIWLFVNIRIKKVRRQNDEKIQINNRIAELEQMALKAQMNPHFIFNSLNSVQQYVIDKDLLGANKFITEFSRLIRLTLDISAKSKISIYEEVSYLTTYLELEKTKFEDKFTYSVHVDPELDPSDWFIPPMILQPYVENSIRHGMRYRPDRQGHIRVSFRLDAQYLECEVTDNGVGRKKAGQYKSEIPIEYQSKGMTLTAKRIEMLNRNQPAPVLINIADLENNHIAAGTRVTLRFPLNEAAMST